MIKKDLRANLKHSFWVYNVSKMNVSLRDLNITIPANAIMNLLDERHHNYTLDQLILSASSGSLYIKRDKLKTTNNPPQIIPKATLQISKEARFIAPRSSVRVEEKKYDEIDDLNQTISEEKFANEFSGEKEEENEIVMPKKR